MQALLHEIRHNPLLWLLVFVPVVLAGEKLAPDAHTFLFVASVLAIVPLAALLSHATESVSAKTGDTVGGLLNSTLGNLTELVIALAALRLGQYTLVKASLAMRLAERAVGVRDRRGALEALSKAVANDAVCLPARALQLDLLADSGDLAAFASQLEAFADCLPTEQARARAFVLRRTTPCPLVRSVLHSKKRTGCATVR